MDSGSTPLNYFRIVNLEKYQHYTNRCPPWIKLHRELLTSDTWVALDDASRVLAIAFMLLASETDNCISGNKAYLKRRCFLNSDPDFQPLLDIGFIEKTEQSLNIASKLIASASASLQSGVSEERREETEKRRKSARAPINGFEGKKNGRSPGEQMRLEMAKKGIMNVGNSDGDFHNWVAAGEITLEQARKAGASI